MFFDAFIDFVKIRQLAKNRKKNWLKCGGCFESFEIILIPPVSQQPFKIKSNLLESCHQLMGVRKRKEDVASSEDTRNTLNIHLHRYTEVRSAIQLEFHCYSNKVLFILYIFNIFYCTSKMVNSNYWYSATTSACEGYYFIELHEQEVTK